jgi:hypothetical protein
MLRLFSDNKCKRPFFEPVTPIAKKYRIVAMVTLRRQADFSRSKTQFGPSC